MKSSTLLIVATAILAGSFAGAVTTGPVAVEPAAESFTIGSLKVIALHDAALLAANDGSVFGVDATPDDVGKLLKGAGLPTDAIPLSINALFVQVGTRAVLLDTGFGPKAHGVLMQSLAKVGIPPDGITDVLITHVHGDHIGGLATADGQSAFPKAKIRMSAAEWTFMKSQSDLAALVKTIAPQVQTFEPGAVLVPGITAVAIRGHTPGHMGYEIVSGNDRILDIGDSAHSSIVSLVKPGWAMGFDSDRVVARASREKLLSALSRSHEKIFSPHFPYPGVGTIKTEGDHYAWSPASQADHQ